MIERIYAPPFWFDVSIGYWTGEPDREALRRGAAALLGRPGCRWHIDAGVGEENGSALDPETALSRLLRTPVENDVVCRATGLRVRRCGREHLHLLFPESVEEAGVLPEADALLTATGLTRQERCADS